MLLNSAVLEVIVGIFFVYLLLALICSALNEWMAGILALRAKTLREGIANLLDDPTSQALAGEFYRHPLVQGLSRKRGEGSRNLPSYIPADVFVRVLLDLTARSEAGARHRTWSEVLADLRARLATGETLRGIEQELLRQLEAAGLDRVKVAQLEQVTAQLATARDALATFDLSDASKDGAAGRFLVDRVAQLDKMVKQIEDEVNATLNRAQANVEDYFNEAMGRVSGWYKRHVQYWIIGIALAVSLLLNVDTFAIVDDLMTEPTLRAAVAELASEWVAAQDAQNPPPLPETLKQQKQLETLGLPLGWQLENLPASNDLAGWLTKVLGILVTTVAVSLGAPFWFDLLNKLVNLRMSGARPTT